MIRSVAFVTNGALSLINFRGTLIAALVRDGVRVWGLAPDFDEAARARLRTLGAEPVDISMARAGMNPMREIVDAWRLLRTLRRLRPEVMLSYFLKPVIWGSLAGWAARVPRRIAMIEGLGYVFADDGAGLKRRALRAVLRGLFAASLARVDTVVFLNAVDADDMVKARLVRPAQVILLGGIGVDLARFVPLPLPPGPAVFLLMARMLREKGVGEFVAAARIVRARLPVVRFVLIGGLDPNPGALTRDEIDGWVREGVVEWHGHVDDVRPWIAAATAVVLPSFYREGVPRSLQEGMAMARPIVTTDNVGCRDTVRGSVGAPGLNGFLVPTRAIEPLVAALFDLATRPDLASAMGRESRRLAEERFDAERQDARLRAVLDGGRDG